MGRRSSRRCGGRFGFHHDRWDGGFELRRIDRQARCRQSLRQPELRFERIFVHDSNGTSAGGDAPYRTRRPSRNDGRITAKVSRKSDHSLNLPRLVGNDCASPSFSRCRFSYILQSALLGLFAADPLYRSGGLGQAFPGVLPGSATIDGNWAGIDQALTWRAMHDLLTGHLPWWNSFEGFGGPLAGEMQCSALFPFSFLIALPNGPMILNTLLSAVAGIGMFSLLRRLRLGLVGALTGAVTFETCGTFSWLSGAWSYSIPWLPFLVLGIELSRAKERTEAKAGIVLTASSLALLLYAGFIETVVSGRPRRRFLGLRETLHDRAHAADGVRESPSRRRLARSRTWLPDYRCFRPTCFR